MPSLRNKAPSCPRGQAVAVFTMRSFSAAVNFFRGSNEAAVSNHIGTSGVMLIPTATPQS